MEKLQSYSRAEEWVSSLTHYLGAALGFVGLGALIAKNTQLQNSSYLTGCLIFSFSVILLYLMSGTYHILTPGKFKKIFKILDHSAIYVLISGSYAPFLLGVFQGSTKWILLWIQVGLTLFGILFKLFFTGKFRKLSTIIYLFMGWMVMFVYKDLQMLLSPLSLKLLIAGGLSYSIGVIFYVLKSIKFTHAIWHLFVLAGTTFTFFSVYFLF